MIPVEGGHIWFGVIGVSQGKPPLVLVHGGPGFPSYAFETFECLSDEREVIFYDQLGCGRSDHVTNTAFFSLDRYVEELNRLLNVLSLTDVHLFGHSWGAKIVTGLAERKSEVIRSLSYSGPDFYTRRWMEDMERHLKAMPDNIGAIIRNSEESGMIDTPLYKEAVRKFLLAHECRLDPTPECMKKATSEFGEQYRFLFGPNEYTCKGIMWNWG